MKRNSALTRRRAPLWVALSSFLVFSSAFTSAPGAATSGAAFPRLANFYLQGAVNPADIPALARWDVLILSTVWTDTQLQQLKSLNPDIKLFFYVCPYCVNVPPNPADPWQQQNYSYVVQNDLWWRNSNGTIASDWPGTQMVNITDLAPAPAFGNWRQYMGYRVENLARAHRVLDGVFYDNFWKTISWQQGGTIQVDSDCNPTHNPAGCNNQMDSNALVDTLWNRALRDLARDTRTRFDSVEATRGANGPQLAIITNSSADYFPWLNGTLYEYFPSGHTAPDPGNPYGYNWNFEMSNVPSGYLVAPFQSDPYRVSVLNADWAGTWDAPNRSSEFERHKRFTLASALMGDGYYSLDAAEMGHGSIWWEPEFDNGGAGKGYLGYPTGPMTRIGLPSASELVVNGSFSSGSTPWVGQPANCTGTFQTDSAIFHTGPRAARINVSSVLPGGSYKLYQSLPVISGHGYTFSFWARASTPQEITIHLYSPSCPSNRCLDDKRFQIGTGWQEFAVSFVATGSASAGLNIFVSQVGSVWLDDFSLREGDTSVYRRDFDHGSVILNYTTTQQSVVLGGTFYRLDIPGSSVFDGAAVTVETVPPSDARILLRNPQSTPSPPPPAVRGQLWQNEPNPFNPSTRIRFSLRRSEHVKLGVYDVAGRLVRMLVNRTMPGDVEHTVSWDSTDRLGMRCRSGIYFYRLTTPSFTLTRKMTLLM